MNKKFITGAIAILLYSIIPAALAQDPLVSIDWDPDGSTDGLNSGTMTGTAAMLTVTQTSPDGMANGGLTLGFDWGAAAPTDGVPGINDAEVVDEFSTIDSSTVGNTVTLDFAGGRVRNPIFLIAFTDASTVIEFPASVGVTLLDSAGGAAVVAGSTVTSTGGSNSGGDGFAVQLTGVFTQLTFVYSDAVPVQSVGFSIAALDSNILEPAPDTVAGGFQPDLLIGKSWKNLRGDNVYNQKRPSKKQTITLPGRIFTNNTAPVKLRLENDGTDPVRMRLRTNGDKLDGMTAIARRVGGPRKNISAALKRGGYRPKVTPGEPVFVSYRLKTSRFYAGVFRGGNRNDTVLFRLRRGDKSDRAAMVRTYRR